jgi:hypothetical protein
VTSAVVAPLLRLVRLRHARADHLAPLSPGAAVRELLASTLCFAREPALVDRLLIVTQAICAAPMWRCDFRKGTHVPDFVHARLARPPAEAA